jgi:hypothetical protein
MLDDLSRRGSEPDPGSPDRYIIIRGSWLTCLAIGVSLVVGLAPTLGTSPWLANVLAILAGTSGIAAVAVPFADAARASEHLEIRRYMRAMETLASEGILVFALGVIVFLAGVQGEDPRVGLIGLAWGATGWWGAAFANRKGFI